MKSGIELITKERTEQIEKHGRTPLYDAQFNTENQLISGIILLTSSVAFARADIKMPIAAFEEMKPDGWDRELCMKMINKPAIEQLQIIGAFAAAEIDRIMLPLKEKE